MATVVNYLSSYEPCCKVSEGLWGGGQYYIREEEGGRVTGDPPAMEVKGQLMSAPELLPCPDRKQRELTAELQERRRSLQTLLSTRLAELRLICLQEAELTGTVPNDFPLEAGEKPPCVRRRGGTHHGNGKSRVEVGTAVLEEDSQRSKLKKTLFSVSVRKQSDSEHSSHQGKRTVHRGCHTDDSVRSESSATSASTGHDHNDIGSQCRPLVVSAGFPVEVFLQNKTRNSRTEHLESRHRPLPHLPPCSQDSSSSSGPSDPGLGGNGAGSDGSDGLLDNMPPPEEGVGGHHGVARVCQGKTITKGFWIADTERRVRVSEEGGVSQERVGGGYSEVLLDYVWAKQNQPGKQPIMTQHQPLYNGCSNQQPMAAPPTYRYHGSQQRVSVTRTKSCGAFLSAQQNQADTHPIQPDPHPHLLPPRPPQLPLCQDSQLEEATRCLHKALALEGLRDWYLRNTLGSSHQNQASRKVTTTNTKANSGVKGQARGGCALQRRQTTHGVIKQSTRQTESTHQAGLHHKSTLPHSATFRGHRFHGRSVDGLFYQDLFLPQKQEVPLQDQPSPGTLV